MKKIININLSGRVIPIEDSAYEKLQSYIESLRRYFASEEGRDEIINDIESRIAELMNEKVRKGAAAVTDADMEEIIASMGRVEDFEAADTENAEKEKTQQSETPNYTYTEKKSRGRLYRDTSDKFIGGVCSGIASYLNADPAIVRILFAIVTFGGFGLGFLAYIILWIVLPPKDLEGYGGKRLYRNPDDRMIGGVAGGLAAYFNKSANTIRIIFAAPIVLSLLVGFLNGLSWRYDADIILNIGFGSLSSTFILAYIILWIVLPEATTSFQKMEMRGEKVDVNRIRQNVKEGMENMKERMKEWGGEVKETAQSFGDKVKEFSDTKGKAFATEVKETAKTAGSGLGHAIGVLFKAFFLFIAGTIAFALFVSLFAMLFSGVAWWPVNNFLWTSKWQQLMAWGTFIFFLLVPLIGFIVWIIRRIIRVKSRSNYLGWTFGGLWTLGWICATLFSVSMAKDFREKAEVETPVQVTQPVKNKMIVTVTEPELEYSGNFGWIDNGRGWDLSSDTLKIAAIKLTVNASNDSLYHVNIIRKSFGKDRTDARERAGQVEFAVLSKDSLLDLGNCYTIAKESKFRGQHVEVEIKVPIGKKIRFDESITEKLNSIDVKVRRSIRRNRINDIDIDDYYFEYSTGVDYVMGVGGTLYNPNAPVQQKTEQKAAEKQNNEGGYRYNENDEPTDAEKEQEKRVEEEMRKLKEIRDKKKTDTLKKQTGFINNDKEEESGDGAVELFPFTTLFSV